MRYSIVDSDFAHPVSAVAGIDLCPIWDEDLGAIVAWVRTDNADLLTNKLNSEEDSRPGATISIREDDDGGLDIYATFDPVYSHPGPNPDTHEVAMTMIGTIPQDEIDRVETESGGKTEVLKKPDEP